MKSSRQLSKRYWQLCATCSHSRTGSPMRNGQNLRTLRIVAASCTGFQTMNGQSSKTPRIVAVKLGRLRLIRCAPSHPNVWMIVWRQDLPEWDPKTRWEGNNEPGPYWNGCDARQRTRGADPEDAICRFPNCDCLNHLPEQKRQELKRLHAERAEEARRYKEEWIPRSRM